MTPKQRVLAKWPEAYSTYVIGMQGFFYSIESRQTKRHLSRRLGKGNSVQSAWADAAKRLEGK